MRKPFKYIFKDAVTEMMSAQTILQLLKPVYF